MENKSKGKGYKNIFSHNRTTQSIKSDQSEQKTAIKTSTMSNWAHTP